jgi:diadenosine tetraphosphate (Ap4A) HIT family hydrolase
MPLERIVLENDLAYAVYDAFPVTPLHGLIIPRRHAIDYFGVTADELIACHDLLRQLRSRVLTEDPGVVAFNIGINVGKAAGQTVFHCHIHLIPRRIGDVEHARGGVRHVIPGKGSY